MRGVTSKTVNANDGTGPHTWHYAITATGGYNEMGVVTDPLGNDTVYTMTGLGNTPVFYPTEVDYYTGSHTSGTLLKTVKTTYKWTTLSSGTGGSCDWQPNTGVVSVVPMNVTTTWPESGQESEISTIYDSSLSANFGAAFGTPVQYTLSYGSPTSKNEYDDGVNAPGSLLRNTTTNYLAFSNPTYLGNNLMNLVSLAEIKSPTAAAAETTYGYDEPGSPQCACGNQTSVHRWLNTTGGYLVTSNVYDSNGRRTSTPTQNYT